MVRPLRLGSWFFCASLAAPLAHAGVLVVDAVNGPYTDLQSAVDAAQPGDTLLVESGTYASFLVNAKPLSIVGDAGADVQISGAVRVRSLPAGTVFTLSNVSATGTSGTLPSRYGLYLSDNLGSIRVANAFFTGAPGLGTSRDGAAGLFCELSPDVVATRCGFFGGQGLNGFEDSVGKSGAGVRATGSTVALWDCVLEGGHGQHGQGNILDAGRGGHGLHATSATAFLSGCFAYGGNGGNGAVPAFRWSIGGTGGHGLRLETGSIARLLEVHADGGQGGENWSGFGLTGYEADGLPTSVAGSQLILLPGSARELQATAVVREGASLAVTLRGVAGDRVGLLVDRETAHVYHPLLFGVTSVPLVRPPWVLLLGTLPASGELTLALPIEWLGGSDVEDLLHLQPLFHQAGGGIRLGSPLSVAVLDPSY